MVKGLVTSSIISLRTSQSRNATSFLSDSLQKHLNVLTSGWQPRWFVLDGGTLSYYDSQEDAWKGCKGSIKISVCEIQGW